MLSNRHNLQNQNTVNPVLQFYQAALSHNLPQAAILLWLSLYFRMQAQGTFADLRIATADLMGELGISRSGLQRARQRLVDAGLLHMEQKAHQAHQALHYTLCLDGNVLEPQQMQDDADIIATAQTLTDKSSCIKATATKQMQKLDCTKVATSCTCTAPTQSKAAVKSAGPTQAEQPTNTSFVATETRQRASTNLTASQAGRQTTTRKGAPDAQRVACPTDAASFVEMILSGKYSATLDEFHKRYPDVVLRGSLRNWAEQRRKNGWALTGWGLQVLLDKLVELADGDVKIMTAIVTQSIQKRWKGFHKLKIEARPSGEALRKLEEKEERAEMQRYRATGNHMPVYKSSYKQDLSALVI